MGNKVSNGTSIKEQIEVTINGIAVLATKEEITQYITSCIPITEITCSMNITRTPMAYCSNAYFLSMKLNLGAAYALGLEMFKNSDSPGESLSTALLEANNILKEQLAIIGNAVKTKIENCFKFIKQTISSEMSKDGIIPANIQNNA